MSTPDGDHHSYVGDLEFMSGDLRDGVWGGRAWISDDAW